MLATSTHDTKRGEDARARLAVLSEMPEQWARQTRLWSRMLRARRRDIEAAATPDRNDEYLFYQLLAASWPTELTSAELAPAEKAACDLDPCVLRNFSDRLKQAMTKSMREAKVHSTWSSPNTAYEDAVLAFIDGALDPDVARGFLGEFLPFQTQISRLGVQNSLVQTTLKLTVPGVPDIYQGAELWNLSLVDPDNRRPVDYPQRTRLLNELDSGGTRPRELMDKWQDGAIKLFVTSRILKLRAAQPQLFSKGEYEPVSATGAKADCICAFARIDGDRAALVVTARFPARRDADPDWFDTTIAMPERLLNRKWVDIFTGMELRDAQATVGANSILADMPVAVFAQAD
jgi:(1->4)-alpha-D-glucan 1-alpha-D-glucosylmutase